MMFRSRFKLKFRERCQTVRHDGDSYGLMRRHFEGMGLRSRGKAMTHLGR